MNSASYLPAQTIMMESPKTALVTPNGMHLRKIEFLPLVLSLRLARAFSKCLVFVLWPLLPKIFLDYKLPFLAHVRDNTLEMLGNVLALYLGNKHDGSTATITISRHFVVECKTITLYMVGQRLHG